MDQRPQHETLKGTEGNVGSNLQDMGIKDFLNQTAAAQEIRLTIDKWDLIKLKSFCTVKEILREVKRKPTEWEEIVTPDNI